MEEILNELYSAYNDLLTNLTLGYPLDEKSLRYMWDLIHKSYFIRYETYANPEIVKILEYYEYI